MPTEQEILERITVRADVFGGKPIIRDMRIAVEHVLGMLAAGDTAEDILREYTFLEPEDIQACLLFAQRRVAWRPPGFPKFTNEVQHQTKVLPWGTAIRSLGLRNAVRLPAYVLRGARSGKSQQLWIARHRRLLGS